LQWINIHTHDDQQELEERVGEVAQLYMIDPGIDTLWWSAKEEKSIDKLLCRGRSGIKGQLSISGCHFPSGLC